MPGKFGLTQMGFNFHVCSRMLKELQMIKRNAAHPTPSPSWVSLVKLRENLAIQEKAYCKRGKEKRFVQ